ncbi:MAG: EAL domain-containing response regulator [Steroidobacteraceae bacterium]
MLTKKGPERPERSAQLGSRSTGTGATINSVLVVDDSAVQRTVVAAFCRELGITEVQEAPNGVEALALLDRIVSPPGLLIIDLEMPAMDGAELLEALSERALPAPIILASSRERALIHSVGDLGTALGLRILGTLQKPVALDALGSLLRNVFAAPAEPKCLSRAQLVDPEALRNGIERGEIVVHFQPQVEIDTGYVRGVEALARWQHPVHGLIGPDSFIRVAEQFGLIHALTARVMEQAMRQTAMWAAQGLELTVAINLSPLLLDRAGLVQEVCELREQHGLKADQVVLEVTESSLPHEATVALGVLTRLRLKGFRLSLDDYGTGFSSMQQLARIPFTELKIEQGFVNGAHGRESLQIILRSALEMASKLGVETVAEGVETLQDWCLLKEYRCTLAQGWLFAKAMPGEQFEGWLKTHLGRRQELRAATQTVG